MKHRYESRWDSFLAIIDEKVGSIRVDLGLVEIAPVAKHDHVIYIRLKMNKSQEDGLSSAEEMDRLWEIEESTTKTLEEKADAILAGTETTDGSKGFYFYSNGKIAVEEMISGEMVKFPEYDYELAEWEEDDWKTYFTFLYPTPEDFERIANRDVIYSLEEQGDDLSVPHKVDHLIYFDEETGRDQFLQQVMKDGFVQEPGEPQKPEEEERFLLQISRTETITLEHMNEVVLKLFHLVEEHGGEYDGWETEVIKNDTGN